MASPETATGDDGRSSRTRGDRARAGALLLSLATAMFPSAAAAQSDAGRGPSGAGSGPPPVLGDGAAALEINPVEQYRRGVASFDYGDCAAALEALEPVAVPGTLGDEKQLIDAYRILGVCYFQAGRSDEAVRTLEALLYIDPNYQLDPFRTPPPVSELFEERKSAIQRKLKQIEEEKRRQGPDLAGETFIIERERVVRETPFPTVFLPFGVAQAINGEGAKGAIIGGLQGLTLASNLAASLAALSIDLSDGHLGSAARKDDLQAQAYTVAWSVSVVALAAFVISYGYGVADAWWNRVPEAEVSNSEKHRRAEGDEAKKLLRRLDD